VLPFDLLVRENHFAGANDSALRQLTFTEPFWAPWRGRRNHRGWKIFCCAPCRKNFRPETEWGFRRERHGGRGGAIIGLVSPRSFFKRAGALLDQSRPVELRRSGAGRVLLCFLRGLIGKDCRKGPVRHSSTMSSERANISCRLLSVD